MREYTRDELILLLRGMEKPDDLINEIMTIKPSIDISFSDELERFGYYEDNYGWIWVREVLQVSTTSELKNLLELIK